MPRSNMIISASTSSATLRVFEKGALKDRDAALGDGVQIDLVGAGAETTDTDQSVRGGESFGW